MKHQLRSAQDVHAVARRVLVVLCLVNYLNYVDRFILAAVLNSIKVDLQLSDFQSGLLATAFMIPYIVSAPLWGWLGDTRQRNRLLSFGVFLWSISTAFTGFARAFGGLLAARFALGVGESAFTTAAPSYLTDFFEKARQGRAMALFSAALPVGAALGYVLGGILSHQWGWRQAFFIVGAPGLVLALLVWRLPEARHVLHGGAEPGAEPLRLSRLPKLFGRNGEYVLTVLGYCAYTFVLGGLAHWMPSFMQREFGYDELKSNMIFGGIAVVSGLTGTLLGGAWGDLWERRAGHGHLKVSFVSMVLALPCFVGAVLSSSFPLFATFLFLTQFCFFISTSPLNLVILNAVPIAYRSMAMATAILAIHILGDAISSPLIGMLSDASGSLRTGVVICIPVIILCILFWGLTCILYWRPVPWPEQALRLPQWQRHRGLWQNSHPENTLAAFRAAKAHGDAMVELDVRMSADGQIVVVHDDDLRRVANSGVRIRDATAADLQKQAQIPLLREVLTDPQCPSFVNIEVKCEAFRIPGLEDGVARVIRETKAEGRVLVSSFNPLVLMRLSRRLPEVPRALLVTHETSDPKNKIYLRKMWLAWLARPHMLNAQAGMVTPVSLAEWSQRGIPVAVWTVDDPSRAAELLKHGVRSVISNSCGPTHTTSR